MDLWNGVFYWGDYRTKTASYNVNGQLTGLNWSYTTIPGFQTSNIQYTYSATNNNGQITQMTDISGETVSYTYDALKRLTGATSVSGGTTAWTQAFGYDGFGNMTSKSLNGGPNSAPAVDPTTNRLTSGYDANGNMLTGYGLTMTYDERNRVASATPTYSGTEYYGYAPDNKRIYRWNPTTGTEEWTFYGAKGERIGAFALNTSGTYYFSATQTNMWFAGQLISGANGFVFRDRVGSNRETGARYYPYGDEITSTSNDTEKYGTYVRDSFTALDYADQRYYASSYGRFNSPDKLGGVLKDPGSLNKYSYVRGDPVNRNDPRGLCDAVIGGITESSGSNSISQFASSIGAMQAFPYAGTDIGTGVNAVLNTSANQTIEAQTAAAAINAAAADSSGPINIFAFSGGAAAFTSAIPLLSSSVIARIQSITYASPGIFGTLGTVNGITPTVIFGQGPFDVAAMLGTVVPPGWNLVNTACGHNADCEFQAALSAESAGNACNQTSTFSAYGLTTFGTLMNLWNEYSAALANSAAAESVPLSLDGFDPYDPIGLLPSPSSIEDITSTITYAPIVP